MSWRMNDAETNFLDELFGDEEAEEVLCHVDVKQEILDDSDVEIEDDHRSAYSPSAPVYCPLSSPKPREYAGRCDRDRSRSPIVSLDPASDPLPSTSKVIIRTCDGKTRQLEHKDLSEDDVVKQNQFLDPDAHVLYVSMNESGDKNVNVSSESERNVRAKLRGRSRGRVSQAGRRGRARRGGLGGGGREVVGRPLEEIWISDDDLPYELKVLVRDVVRKREIIAQKMRDRVVRNGRDTELKGEESESENEDDFQDATDGRDSPLLEAESFFEWSTMETFRPEEELFIPERTGSVKCHQTPYDAFRSFWDDSVMEHIVKEMNLYASNTKPSAIQSDWYPTNVHEVMCLFAFWMMLGIVRMPTIKSCFSTDPLLRTEIFSRIFTLSRYTALMRALHFVDADSSSDPLYSLRPIITKLNANFQASYIPSKDICIDVGLTLWKGRLKTNQYIQSKAAKLGIKTFELCESATGYLWSFIVCTKNNTSLVQQEDPRASKSTALIKEMIDPLLNKGYRLFMDNLYNSPLLARFLKRNGTDCVGKLRPCRQDVPALINVAPLKQGQLIARHSGDVCVLSWHDNKRVTMMSTCHGAATGLTRVPSRPGLRPVPFKPQVVLDHNKSMGGVDLKDQMLEPYLLERKRGEHWHMKLFKQLLNVSILNARILMESSLQCRQDQLNFRLRLVDAILANHLSHIPQSRRHIATISRTPHPCRKVPYVHWPIRVEASEGYASKNRKTRVRCTVCLKEGRKTTKTTFKCEGCNVPLCVENCFKKYHTM